MGIIIDQLFHSAEGITEEKYKCFFFDMGENIHFHYRDLRIELSVEEFQELIESIDRYKGDVQKEIDNGYLDGILPNTNEKHTVKTFWNRERLKHKIKYNPQRISIEENTDGYHIHFRHYKFLLDKASFISFAEGMSQSLNKVNNKGEIDPIDLLKLNELQPKLIIKTITEEAEETKIQVKKKYFSKTRQVLHGLGYKITSSDNLKQVFEHGNKKLIVMLENLEINKVSEGSDVAQYLPLDYFISKVATGMDPASLNKLKLNLLFLFKQVEQGKIEPFTLDDISINIFDNHVVVNTKGSQLIDLDKEYKRLSTLYSDNKLSMSKPKKVKYNRKYIKYISDKFLQYINQTLAPLPCVKKVYLFGSKEWETGGEYQEPYIHFDWAKLGSDFDLYIEIDEDYMDTMPKQWDKKFFHSPASAYYYHLGDLSDKTDSLPLVQYYSGIKFYQHLLEAYLFLPSKGDAAIKKKYIEEYKGELIYEKSNVSIELDKHYKIKALSVKEFTANSHNQVYKIISDENIYVYKIYNKQTSLQPGMVSYEVKLLNLLRGKVKNIAFPVVMKSGEYITQFEGNECVLYDYISGDFTTKPTLSQAKLSGNLIAKLHKQASKIDLDVGERYTQTAIYKLWVNNAIDFVTQKKMDIYSLDELSDIKINLDNLSEIETFLHGDLAPKNFKFREDSCSLFDFEQSSTGLRIFDVIDAMIEFSIEGEHCNKKIAFSLFDAYKQEFPLSKSQLNEFNKALEVIIMAKITRLYRTHLVFDYRLNVDTIKALESCIEALKI